MFFYEIADVSICSQFKIPTLIECRKENSFDIKIFTKNIRELDTIPQKKQTLHIGKEIFHHDKSGLIYRISENSDITVYVRNESEINIIHESIIGIPFGYALSKNRFNVMHGSSFATKNKAVCVAGISGSGKSTMSLCAINNGFKFITEDLCLFRGNSIFQYNSWIKTTKNLLNEQKICVDKEIDLVTDSRDRKLFKLNEKFCSKTSKVDALYFPIQSDQMSIAKITAQEAFKYIFTNFYRQDYDKASDLEIISNIAQNLNCYQFYRDIKAPVISNAKYLFAHINSN